MTFLLLQAFLLMAAAYFLGAFLGCWWRRAFYEPAKARTARGDGLAAATAGTAVATGAVSVPRTDPIPVQPRIEHVDSPEAIAARHRFERALSGTGILEDTPQDVRSASDAQPEPQAHEPPPQIDIAPRALVTHEQPPPAVHAVPPPPEPDPAAARATDDAVAAAAAAAAAAMTVAAAHRATTPAEPAPPAAPPVAASGGMAGVSAEVRVPPLIPTDGQNLKLIRDIDEETERKLHSLGVWRYSDLARWTHADVAAINAALGTRARVQRENWIEQATILSRGGLTAYARRRMRGEFAGAHPTEAVHPSRTPMPANAAGVTPPPAAPSYRPAGSPLSMANAAAAAVAAAAAAGNRGRAAGHRPPPPVRAPRPVITELASPQPSVREPAPASVPMPPQAEPTAAAAPPAPAPVKADALQRIRGVDETAEHALLDNGVTRYEQIANWTATEVEYFDELLEAPGRVSHQNWIEQAQILSRGATTLYARQRDSALGLGVGGAAAVAAAAATAASTVQATPAAARPSRLVDAMRMNQQRAAPPPPAEPPPPDTAQSPETDVPDEAASQESETEAGPAPSEGTDTATPPRNGVTGLRSVRSEALRTNRYGGPSEAVDDLKRIRGIGVLIEKKLNSLGIASYDQIANWTVDDIAHISEVLDFRGRIERENWVEQARILSAGGQTEFSRRVDRGDIS